MEASPVRFQYGRLYPSRQPKSCLATQRVGDFIFFGISRCNKIDVFKKTEARKIATERLQQANVEFATLVSLLDSQGCTSPSFYVSAEGMCGFAHLCAISFIFDYFSKIDPVVAEAYQQFQDTRRFSTIYADYGTPCECGARDMCP